MRMRSDAPGRSPLDEIEHVIVVDVDRAGEPTLVWGLSARGVRSDVCLPQEATSRVAAGRPTALVLGPRLALPAVCDICRQARLHTHIPIIAVLESDAPDHLSMALEAGADAALTTSHGLSPGLIISSIRAIQRRERQVRAARASVIEAGSLRIDLFRKTVERDGKPIPLTATEFGILAVLAQHPGRVFSADTILRRVQGYDASEGEAQHIVKVHISRLRQKLDSSIAGSGGIGNVRGHGYMFVFERRGRFRSLEYPGTDAPDAAEVALEACAETGEREPAR